MAGLGSNAENGELQPHQAEVGDNAPQNESAAETQQEEKWDEKMNQMGDQGFQGMPFDMTQANWQGGFNPMMAMQMQNGMMNGGWGFNPMMGMNLDLIFLVNIR